MPYGKLTHLIPLSLSPSLFHTCSTNFSSLHSPFGQIRLEGFKDHLGYDELRYTRLAEMGAWRGRSYSAHQSCVSSLVLPLISDTAKTFTRLL